MTQKIRRAEQHSRAKRKVAKQLRGAGLNIETMPHGSSYDLHTNGLRVAVKGAAKYVQVHKVVVGGKLYKYRYLKWHFNFHRHNRMRRYADFVCCVLLEKRAVYVIPWTALRGKTFTHHVSQKGHEYGGRFARFLNNWHAIVSAAKKAT